jgi:hypothetical protein
MKKTYLSALFTFAVFSVVFAQNNVGIGTNTPDASAKLDISSTNMGLLIPRVSLSNVTTWGLAAGSGTNGMLVYNTNAAITGGSGTGFYFWNGTWTKVVAGTTASLTNGRIWIGNASNAPAEQTLSGDVTINNTGITTIQDNAVDGTDISIASESNGSLMYFNGTDWVNLAPGTSGQILRTNGAGAPTWVNATTIIKAQNGVNIATAAPNATAADPYVELGGTLIRGTTIAQGTNTLAFTLSSTNGFNVDGATFSVDAANDRVGIGTTTPGNKLSVNGTIEAIDFGAAGSQNIRVGDDAYLSDVDAANTMAIMGSSNNAIATLQLGSNGNSYIFGSGGNIGVKTTSLIQDFNVGGRMNISNGVIQMGGTAITGTSDLGLYSRTSGAWIRIVTNGAPINFFSDDNTGTSVNVSIAANGVLEAQKGFRTERHIRYYKRTRSNGQGGVDDLGNYDFCYLSGVAFRNSDSVSDEDDDYQCNVYSLDINGSADYNEGENENFSNNFNYNTRPFWRIYSECYQDCSNSTCTALCINFDY